MNVSRRAFLVAAGAIPSLPRMARSSSRTSGVASVGAEPPPRFDPWIEVNSGALRHNAAEAQRLSGRPVLAVIKNNAYGLGLTRVGTVLDGVDGISVATSLPNLESSIMGFRGALSGGAVSP